MSGTVVGDIDKDRDGQAPISDVPIAVVDESGVIVDTTTTTNPICAYSLPDVPP